jgi:hypothetical protein
MEAALIWREYPLLYHMAAGDSLESIAKHGLLSTTGLLDLFGYSGRRREEIVSCHRPESILISHSSHGTASIRDQKPMSDSGLKRCLSGMTVKKWYRLLNGKVFFWLTEERLLRMLHARPYREKEHCVLVVKT